MRPILIFLALLLGGDPERLVREWEALGIGPFVFPSALYSAMPMPPLELDEIEADRLHADAARLHARIRTVTMEYCSCGGHDHEVCIACVVYHALRSET